MKEFQNMNPICNFMITNKFSLNRSLIKIYSLELIYYTPITKQGQIQDYPYEGAPTYDFAKISEKLHEIDV